MTLIESNTEEIMNTTPPFLLKTLIEVWIALLKPNYNQVLRVFYCGERGIEMMGPFK